MTARLASGIRRGALLATLLCAACATTTEWAGAGPLAAVPPGPPATSLGGTWLIELTVPAGQPYAGAYYGRMVLADDGGVLAGAVAEWSNGARSRLAGRWDGERVRLARVDEAPYQGFRAWFEGGLLPSGALGGSFRNDPAAPWGNAAVGSWRAARVE